MNKIIGRCHFLTSWGEWDDSIHSDEAQIERQGRSMTYPFTFKVNKKAKNAKFSSSSSLPYYLTTLSECNCGDFENRRLPCKHIYRLAVELGIIEIVKRKRTFDKETLENIKSCADIDSHPEQIKRQESAKNCKIISIDYESKKGVFAGSSKTPYETSLTECTCKDYILRRLPCKHIYRLRAEFENHTSGMN